ncbi:DNA helicase [Tanacetum coccineum]
MSVLRNRLLMEEKSYDRQLLAVERDQLLPMLNENQRQIFNLIVNACFNNQQQLVFVYGHGGTCKTFLWKTIVYTLRCQGKIVLAVASSGIASLLLPARRTAHSRFKIPLDLTNTSTQKIGTPDDSDPENTSWIDIPDEYCIPNDENGITNLIDFIYDDDTLHYPSAQKFPRESNHLQMATTSDPQNMAAAKGKMIMVEPEVSDIVALKPGDSNKIIEAIVYRKWLSKHTDTQKPIRFCCILMDKQGTPIQANMDAKDRIF